MIDNPTMTGIGFVDQFRAFFRADDLEVPPRNWLLRPEVASARERLMAACIFDPIFSRAAILHIGFRDDDFDMITRPINERAIGFDKNYAAAYDEAHLPFETASQDVVWSSFYLQQLEHPVAAIKDWLRILKPGGYLVLSNSLVESVTRVADATHMPAKQISLAKLFGIMDEIFQTYPCRIVHCAQTSPTFQEIAGEDILSEIDLVIEKITASESIASSDDRDIKITEIWNEAIQFHQQGNLDLAERHYQDILRLEPDNFSATHMLGVVHFQKNRLDVAESLLRRAISLNGGVTEAHYNLGCVLRAAARFQEARASFEYSLILNPEFEMAQTRLKEMQELNT